eukprot:TRINITY_DN7431_c0_g1_i2.p1 TRINITY_DN7431_c0_g1~~TRINITY_DN7431_c0_g1_i2.p1  ORF type:complete len:799 (+),score=181.72 TRINITY_DN7431_c0_g1_i2:900-3296(+)
MYEVLLFAMKRADCRQLVGYSIVFECIDAITKIYANPTLLECAANNVSQFLASEDPNLKYLGLKALGKIVKIIPSFANKHQMQVIECLNDTDETIQRNTLNLLFQMTNTNNVIVVADRLIQQLEITTDPYLRKELVSRLISLTELYSPDHKWYIDTMNKIFVIGGDLVKDKVAYDLIGLLAEGSTAGEDLEYDNQLRTYAVNSYMLLAERPVLTDVSKRVISWILGEYSYLVKRQDEAIDILIDLFNQKHDDSAVQSWILSAISKLIAQTNNYPDHVKEIIEAHKSSSNLDVQQRCFEIDELTCYIDLMQDLFPLDSSCEEILVDTSLSFLDGFIADAVQSQRVPDIEYIPDSERTFNIYKPREDDKGKLKYEYDRPTVDNVVVSSFPSSAPNIWASGLANSPGSSQQSYQPTTRNAEPDSFAALASSGPWGNDSEPEPEPEPQTEYYQPDPPQEYDQNRNAGNFFSNQRTTQNRYHAEPESEPQINEKDKAFANALFGGLSGGPSSANSIYDQPTGSIYDQPNISTQAPNGSNKDDTYAYQIHENNNFNLQNLSKNMLIREYIQPYPTAFTMNQFLFSHPAVNCAYQIIWHPDCTYIAIFSSNKLDTPLEELTYELSIPNCLVVSPIPDQVHVYNGSSIIVGYLPPKATAVAVLRVEGIVDIQSNIEITGHVVSPVFREPIEIYITHLDIMRPHQITLDEYGKLWGKYQHQKSNIITTESVNSSATFANHISSRNFQVIKIIGSEAVTCARILGQQEMCLLHGKILGDGNLNILVRSNYEALSTCVNEAMEEYFSNQ